MRRLISLIVCILIVISGGTVVTAASFQDIENQNWNWARDSVETMASKGIITGYPDGSFGPADSVTKIQSIILLARILGVNESENSEFAELAQKEYKNTLLTYSTSYKKEISYLLYKGVLDKSELDSYISVTNANQPLKRYEAAVLLTKLFGAEDEVKAKAMIVLPFHDINDIPEEAQGYVEFVKKQGIMSGMSDTEFGPNYNVTRAQMAVMLYRVMNKIDANESKVEGILTEIDDDEIEIKNVVDVTRTYRLSDNVKLRFDGEEADIDDFKIGSDLLITIKDGEVVFLEGLTSEVISEEEIDGILEKLYYSSGSRKIKVEYEDGNDTETESYPIDVDIDVTKDGRTKNIDALETGDIVKLYLYNDNVIKIEAQSKDQTVEGTVKEVEVDPDFKIIIEDEDGKDHEYVVEEDVYVKKNGRKSSMKYVRPGNEVELKLEYDIVVRIEAESDDDDGTGIIEEINISKNMEMTLKIDGESVTYPVDRNVEVEIDDEKATIYDLKLGYTIEFTVEDDTITEIETNAVSMSKQLTGTVESVNEGYGLIRITVVDDSNDFVLKQVFVSDDTTIIESKRSRSLDLDDIDEGDVLTAIGSEESGVFEATTIVIINN